ncbi:MAG: protein-glutamate O-methyltransferase CheR [Elusimicrobiaceae bacterium]
MTNLTISDTEFCQVRDLMYKLTGVLLKDSKKPLVISRLRKRLIELGLSSFTDYLPKLMAHSCGELEIFINAITTNETFFFRHDAQFDCLKNEILPSLTHLKESLGKPKEIRVWSAACSTGEEPYTLAILLSEYFRGKHNWSFSILASDINTEVLRDAAAGIYSPRSVRDVDPELLARYFTEIPSETHDKKAYAVSPRIKALVTFRRHNLLNPPIQKNNDIVFLRNVMIYFDSDAKQRVVGNIQGSLAKDGYFFISLAEHLHDIKCGMKFWKSGIFRNQD